MDIRTLAGKNICILGYGREGQAMAEALIQHAKECSIVIADKNPELRIMNYELRSGDTYLDHLDDFDVIIKSPGIPPHSKLKAQSSKLTSSTQIFLDSIASSGATVIGVTGSKGKSTTSSLIHHILKAAGKRSFLVGNIGEPAIAHLNDASLNTACGEPQRTIFVQEMSSYQLMDLTSSPHIAVITSFFPEHLDYHSTRPAERGSLMASRGSNTPLENYLDAKKNITRFQTSEDVAFFNADSDGAKSIAEESNGTKIPFSIADAPVTLEDIQLRGEHNLGNIAAAYKVALHLGVNREIAIAAIKSFKGLPHRLESLGVHDGIEWINDSISTTPESTVAALNALGDRVSTIILGGQDRGYDFSPLIQRLKTSSVKTVILMPDSGATIRKKLKEANVTMKLLDAVTMKDAVETARNETKKLSEAAGLAGPAAGGLHLEKGEPTRGKRSFPFVILLSPAAPSYGHFKNFEDRGEQYKSCIQG